ncbi:MAG: hypothetical protein ACE5QW_03635 [Thermoplasmata archaeon]
MPVRKEVEIKDLRPGMRNVMVEARVMKLSGIQKTKKGMMCVAFLKQGKFRARLRLESDMIGTVGRGDSLKLFNFDILRGKITLVPTERSIIVANGKRVWIGRKLREIEARRKREMAAREG